MSKMKLLTLIVGVAISGVICTDQSEETTPNEGPISTLENESRERRHDIPEVVLQLKYDKGELNRIYLTQFRKEAKSWIPSVSTRGNLCADLCHAGLGGEACGSTCPQLMPIGLKSALQDGNHTDEEMYGQPRYSVCPALCSNHLGGKQAAVSPDSKRLPPPMDTCNTRGVTSEPLCNCADQDVEHAIDWTAVCTAFCYEGYTLNGCPTCDSSSAHESHTYTHSARVLSTSEGWAAWCNAQCRQGQGGAACNCSRTPFQ